MMIKQLWDDTVGALFQPESKRQTKRHTLSEWEGFMLACIQLQQDREGAEGDQLTSVPYVAVQELARSLNAPHTSCQKIKEGFESLEQKGLIQREAWPYNRVRLLERLNNPSRYLSIRKNRYEALVRKEG